VLSAGCDDFIPKPFKESMIFQILSKHLGVKYIYEKIAESEGDNVTETPLTSENLKVMSLE
jgi:FixJ family two-component response regulator